MKKLVGAAIAMTTLLAGCGSKTDANEKNFGAAIAHYLDKKGDLCLSHTKWPVDVSDMDLRLQKSTPIGTARQMAALESVGLIKSTDTDVDSAGTFGKPNATKFKVKRYTLTEKAKPFIRTEDVENFGLDGKTKETRTVLCWGKKALDKVVKWEGPMKFGDYQSAGVIYLYKIDGLADWAKKPDILAAYPHMAQIIEGAGKKELQHGVKLTSVDWEAKGLDQ